MTVQMEKKDGIRVIFWRMTWIHLGNNQIQSAHSYTGPLDSSSGAKKKTLPTSSLQICILKLATRFRL